MAKRVGAFFDLDSTLLTVNSGSLWIQRERRVGRLTRLQVLEAMVYLIGYRLNRIDMVEAMAKGLATIRGEREEVLARWTREWYYAEVASTVAQGARRALFAHRSAGHQLVLLSMTSPYQAQVVVEHLSLDGAIHTYYELEDGVFTGRPVLPLCYGEGKVYYAEKYAAEHDIDLDKSYFYTDSASDIPMLERAGFPRAVNPDPRLTRVARERQWPILRWDRGSRRDHALPGL
ncbi:MAG: HAD-IB family hydrolase [Myxococcales bacterium]|nr:HAD-IB family hydrolase [Myxococcales bacterium]